MTPCTLRKCTLKERKLHTTSWNSFKRCDLGVRACFCCKYTQLLKAGWVFTLSLLAGYAFIAKVMFSCNAISWCHFSTLLSAILELQILKRILKSKRKERSSYKHRNILKILFVFCLGATVHLYIFVVSSKWQCPNKELSGNRPWNPSSFTSVKGSDWPQQDVRVYWLWLCEVPSLSFLTCKT